MKNLIYQYWDGEINEGAKFSSKLMKAYAKQIESDYIFELNPKFRTDLGKYSPHYGQFKIVYDSLFNKYDKILFADTDVFPVENLNKNIFDEFTSDVGICTEPYQPKARLKMKGSINSKNDEKWAKAIEKKWKAKMPRGEDGLLKVYNSGVVLYSQKGIEQMRKRFVDFKKYVNYIKSCDLPVFYTCDQPYLHAMLKVCELNYQEMENGWNSYIHYILDENQNKKINDTRNKNTKFVHIQLRGADNFSEDVLWRITNRSIAEWGI